MLHAFNWKPFSSFLGKRLKIRPFCDSVRPIKLYASRSKNLVVLASGIDLTSFANDLFVGVGVGLSCMVMECGDVIYRSTLPKSNGLTPTVPGVLLPLGTLSYLWATPSVAPGFFDMFMLAFIERLFRPTYKNDDFVLGKKLGEGSFGVVYRASFAKTPSAKGELVVKKATEYGAVEIWMNERVQRACPSSCADFVYGFLEVYQDSRCAVGGGKKRCSLQYFLDDELMKRGSRCSRRRGKGVGCSIFLIKN